MNKNEEDIQEFNEKDINYLKLLSRQYPTIASASTEIINLQAILNLPKGTEHFMSDIHGEYESFNHVLKNGSGVIKRKIDETNDPYIILCISRKNGDDYDAHLDIITQQLGLAYPIEALEKAGMNKQNSQQETATANKKRVIA